MKRYETLIKEVHKRKPRTILEIGTHRAIRAEQMVQAAQLYNPVKYIGFDLFEELTPEIAEYEHHGKKPPSYEISKKVLEKIGCEFELIKGNTKDTLPNYQFNIKYPLFIWLDAGHSIDSIFGDFCNIESLINNETTLILDDYYPDNMELGCKRLVEVLKSEFNTWNIKLLEPADILSDKTIYLVKVTLK